MLFTNLTLECVVCYTRLQCKLELTEPEDWKVPDMAQLAHSVGWHWSKTQGDFFCQECWDYWILRI